MITTLAVGISNNDKSLTSQLIQHCMRNTVLVVYDQLHELVLERWMHAVTGKNSPTTY